MKIMDTLNAISESKNPEPSQMLDGRQPETSARSRQKLRWFLLVGAVALVCIIASRHIRLGEFDYYVDEAQHAVTGLFVADALHDLPLRHPVQYAYAYYAQYPAVAILHWPPLFYLFEGVSFILFGATAASARLTVICFAVLLLYQWFLLVEELQDSYTAAICTAVLGLLPNVLLIRKNRDARSSVAGSWSGYDPLLDPVSPQGDRKTSLFIWSMAQRSTLVQANQRVLARFLCTNATRDPQVGIPVPTRCSSGRGHGSGARGFVLSANAAPAGSRHGE